MTPQTTTCTAFEGLRRIASGARAEVALAVKRVLERGEQAPVLVFDDLNSQPVEFDLRGSDAEVQARLAGEPGGRSEDGEAVELADGGGRARAAAARGWASWRVR